MLCTKIGGKLLDVGAFDEGGKSLPSLGTYNSSNVGGLSCSGDEEHCSVVDCGVIGWDIVGGRERPQLAEGQFGSKTAANKVVGFIEISLRKAYY
jgi:hypothetical protein